MIAAGKANKEVAVELGLSVRTVCYRIEQIRVKLHAANRTEAVAKFYSAGRDRGPEGSGPLPST